MEDKFVFMDIGARLRLRSWVVGSVDGGRRRKWIDVFWVEDDEFLRRWSGNIQEERRRPQCRIDRRLVDNEAYVELVGNVGNSEQVIALVDATDSLIEVEEHDIMAPGSLILVKKHSEV